MADLYRDGFTDNDLDEHRMKKNRSLFKPTSIKEQPEVANDKTPMPFGKHKDEKLGDVPASYLLWLVDSTSIETTHPEIYAYIDNNRRWLLNEAQTWKD